MNKEQIQKIIKIIETRPTKLEYCKLILNQAFCKFKLLLDRKYNEIKNFNDLHGE